MNVPFWLRAGFRCCCSPKGCLPEVDRGRDSRSLASRLLPYLPLLGLALLLALLLLLPLLLQLLLLLLLLLLWVRVPWLQVRLIFTELPCHWDPIVPIGAWVARCNHGLSIRGATDELGVKLVNARASRQACAAMRKLKNQGSVNMRRIMAILRALKPICKAELCLKSSTSIASCQKRM